MEFYEAMNTEFLEALEALEKERGIPKEYMLERVEAALLSAYKRDAGIADNAYVKIGEDLSDVKMYLRKTVAEEVTNVQTEISLEEARVINPNLAVGDVTDIEIKPKNFGRISAQTAKQVIIQGIREAERSMLYDKFTSKESEIVTGTVSRVDSRTGNAVVEISGTETVLLKNEQVPGETYREGKYVKVYVVEVRKSHRGVQLMISRTHPGLVKRLFELEVPEIYDGTVEIKAISREAGSRTKVAVWSKDENVDPVGSCIGPRGTRITSIVNELGGEKIDIIHYSEEPLEFVALALSPAEVIAVDQTDDKVCRVWVPDDQLSLAIGKEGQNARLAARLTGWKIDICPVSEREEMVQDEICAEVVEEEAQVQPCSDMPAEETDSADEDSIDAQTISDEELDDAADEEA
jgi:N utilization substance protein A